MNLLHRVAPFFLLAAAAGFGESIGTLAEATQANTADLIENTSWGVARGSYVLSVVQTSTGGRDNLGVIPPMTIAPPVSSPANNDTNNNESTSTRQPIFITQPNLGFRVILTADFSAYQGQDSPIVNPGRVVLVAINPPDSLDGASGLSISDVTPIGISNLFVGAPTETGEVSTAGSLYVGDGNSAPTVLAADPNYRTPDPGATPTAATPYSAQNPHPGSTTDQLDAMAGAAALASVPEPSTAIGVSVALIGLGWLRRRTQTP